MMSEEMSDIALSRVLDNLSDGSRFKYFGSDCLEGVTSRTSSHARSTNPARKFAV